MAWVEAVLESEFFWGIIVGIVLTVIGSYFLALFQAQQQRKERRSILKNFCIDTVTNIRQIVDDMNTTRSKAMMIHHEYLALLDIENQVFSRNREQLIYLPLDVRDRARKFVTDCAIRRAEIGNFLTTFYNQMTLRANSKPKAMRWKLKTLATRLPVAHSLRRTRPSISLYFEPKIAKS